MLAKCILLLLFGVLAGFINVMAGGGSTLTMPLLIFLSLNGAEANGTNRVAVLFQNIAAVTKYHRDDLYDLRQALLFSAWALPGAVIGAFVAITIQDAIFRRILAFIIIGVMVVSSLPPKKAIADDSRKTIWIYPALLLIGFYAGFIQAGVGFLLLAAFVHLAGMNLVQANKYKVFIILFTSLPALLVFFGSDNIHLPFAAALSIGNSFGGWWAAHLSLRKGEKLIRRILIIASVLIALKLLGVF